MADSRSIGIRSTNHASERASDRPTDRVCYIPSHPVEAELAMRSLRQPHYNAARVPCGCFAFGFGLLCALLKLDTNSSLVSSFITVSTHTALLSLSGLFSPLVIAAASVYGPACTPSSRYTNNINTYDICSVYGHPHCYTVAWHLPYHHVNVLLFSPWSSHPRSKPS